VQIKPKELELDGFQALIARLASAQEVQTVTEIQVRNSTPRWACSAWWVRASPSDKYKTTFRNTSATT
jgi:hypothetical protein